MINLIEWIDRIVQFPKRFYLQNNNDGTVTLLDASGTVAEAGTPVTAGHLNAMRSAILQAAPVSAVMHFASATAPDGWLLCDGSAVSRATYADLFAAIGILYGAGNGSTTFNLPDLRGEFIRGADEGRGIDPGREVGSMQDGTRFSTDATGSRYLSGGDSGAATSASSGGSSWSETRSTIYVRPRNVALLPCIKY